MPPTRHSGPEYPHHFAYTIKIATKLLLVSTFAMILGCLFAMPAHAQGSLPLGTILVGDPYACPQGAGWFSYTNGPTQYTMNCFGAMVSCPNTQQISATFAYLNPVGKVPSAPQALGLIVYFDGDGGKAQGSIDYARAYFEAGYEIVQVEWAYSWEQTYFPFPNTTPKTYGNIQNAACRPATLLNYIYQSIFLSSVYNSNHTAGMCAQGISAGSAALAYSLAYYGAGGYLDNVELVSGPVLSDVEQGCQVPSPQQNQWPVVCGLNGGNQYG